MRDKGRRKSSYLNIKLYVYILLILQYCSNVYHTRIVVALYSRSYRYVVRRQLGEFSILFISYNAHWCLEGLPAIFLFHLGFMEIMRIRNELICTNKYLLFSKQIGNVYKIQYAIYAKCKRVDYIYRIICKSMDSFAYGFDLVCMFLCSSLWCFQDCKIIYLPLCFVWRPILFIVSINLRTY